MKKSKILNIFIAILLLISIQTLSIAATGTVNSGTVRVREKPTTESEIVEVVNQGDKINITGEDGNWYKVKVGNVEGYIRKDLLAVEGEVTPTTTPEPPAEEPETPTETPAEPPAEDPNTNPEVNTNITKNDKEITTIESGVAVGQTVKLTKETKIKALPLANSSNMAKLEADTDVTVLEVINKWCRIEQGDYAGWVRID